MRTDRQRNITKLIVAFRSFANAPKNKSIKAVRRFCWLLWGCQFSFTASRRFQNHILLRPRDKQLVLKPAEGYIRFSPRLLFMLVSSSINDNTEASRYAAAKSYLFSSHPPTCLAYQVQLTCYLLFL
jgi:hypothetical protein